MTINDVNVVIKDRANDRLVPSIISPFGKEASIRPVFVLKYLIAILSPPPGSLSGILSVLIATGVVLRQHLLLIFVAVVLMFGGERTGRSVFLVVGLIGVLLVVSSLTVFERTVFCGVFYEIWI